MARNIFYLFVFLILDKIDAAEDCSINRSFDVESIKSEESVNYLRGFYGAIANISNPLIYDDLRPVVEKILNHRLPDEEIKNFFLNFIARLNNEAKTIEQQRILLNYICALVVQDQAFCEKVKMVETIFFVYHRTLDKKYFTMLLDLLIKAQSSQNVETLDWFKKEAKMIAMFFSQEKLIFIFERLKTAPESAIEVSLIDYINFVHSQNFVKNPFLPTCEQLINLFIKKNSAAHVMNSKIFFDLFSKLMGMCQLGENFAYIEAALLFFSRADEDSRFYLEKIDKISRKTFSPAPTFAAYICAFAQIQKNDYTLFNELIEEIESPRRSHEDLPRLFCETLEKNKYIFDLQQYLSMFGVNLSQAMPKTQTFFPFNPLSPPLEAAEKVIVSQRPQIKRDLHNGNQFSSVPETETFLPFNSLSPPLGTAGKVIVSQRPQIKRNLDNRNQFSSVISNSQYTFRELPNPSGEERFSRPETHHESIPDENRSDFVVSEYKVIDRLKEEFIDYFKKKDAKRMSCSFSFLTNDEIVKKFIKRSAYLDLNKDAIASFKIVIAEFLKAHAQ